MKTKPIVNSLEPKRMKLTITNKSYLNQLVVIKDDIYELPNKLSVASKSLKTINSGTPFFGVPLSHNESTEKE